MSRGDFYFFLALFVLAFGMCGVMSIVLITRGVNVDGPRFGMMVVLAMLLSIPIILFRNRLSGFFSGLFWSESHFDRPQPKYSVPESHRVQNRFHEAIAAYEEILAEFPDDLRSHTAIMEIYYSDLHDLDGARRAYECAKQEIHNAEDRERLEALCREMEL